MPSRTVPASGSWLRRAISPICSTSAITLRARSAMSRPIGVSITRRAFDEGYAQLVFQLADLRGKRGLADEAGCGRAPEVLVVGEGDEIAEVTEVHGDLNS